jgi:integrase
MPLKLTRRKGSPTWQITGTVAGQRVRESAGTADRKLANEKRAALEARLVRGEVFGQRAIITFPEAVDSYLNTAKPGPGDRALIAKLVLHFGLKRLVEIDQGAVDKALEAICRPDAAPATRLRNVITPLRAILMHSAVRGWCDRPTFETPAGASGTKRTRWLRPDEYRALVQAAAPHLRPLITFLACTGARLSEALYLDWRDVQLEHKRAVLRDVKGSRHEERDRIVDLPPAAVAALATLPHREGAVFLTDEGKPYVRLPDDTQYGGQIKRAWATACRLAGFAGEWRTGESGGRWWQPEDVTPHVLRHTYATWHYAVHRDLLRLKADGDWSSVTLVERYAKLAPPELRGDILAAWGLGDGLKEAVA